MLTLSSSAIQANAVASPIAVARPLPRAHQVVAEALRMCALGHEGETITSRLKVRGLSDGEAAATLATVERQLAFKRSAVRKIRSRIYASVFLQLLVAVVLMAVNTAAISVSGYVLLASLLCRGWLRLNPRPTSPFECSPNRSHRRLGT